MAYVVLSWLHILKKNYKSLATKLHYEKQLLRKHILIFHINMNSFFILFFHDAKLMSKYMVTV